MIGVDRKGEYPNIFNYTIPAYTVAELGEMLPHIIKIKGKKWFWATIKFNDTAFEAHLIRQGMEEMKNIYCCKTEADARATTAVYLIEHDLLDVSTL